MKKALIFGCTIASALANPTAGKRELAAWDQTSTLAGGCHFMSTADIFKFRVDAGFSEPTGYLPAANEGSTSISNWVDPNYGIHLGTFEIDFVLMNKVTADNNYNFFEYFQDKGGGSPGWLTSPKSPGTWDTIPDEPKAKANAVMKICFYKNTITGTPCADATMTYTQELTFDDPQLPLTGMSSVTDTTAPIDVEIRKVLGVASKCGVGDSGGYDLTGTAEDIFVWSELKSVSTIDYQATITYVDATGAEGLDPGAGGLAGINGEGAVKFSLTANHNHDVHDLLFVEGKVATTEQAGTFSQNTNDQHLQFNYNVGYDASGQFKRDSTTPVSVQCSSEFTVDASGNTKATVHAGQAHWHCYRAGDNTNVFPATVGGQDSAGTGNAVGQNGASGYELAALTTDTVTKRHSTCTARLKLSCTGIPNSFDITGEDKRSCEKGNQYSNETDGILGVMNETDCADTAFFTRTYSYAAYSPFEVTYEGAIVQAVRLSNSRRYPKDIVNKATGNGGESVSDLFPNVISAWECGDASGDCSAEDPYVVLYTGASSSSVNCPAITTVGVTDTNGVSSVSGVDSNGEWTQSCSVVNPSVNEHGDNQNPLLDSTKKTLLEPPANFPETYVFAAVSFDYVTRDQTVKITEGAGAGDDAGNVVGGNFTNTSAVDMGEPANRVIQPTDVDDDTDSRRLLRSVAAIQPSTHLLQVIDATQNVVA